MVTKPTIYTREFVEQELIDMMQELMTDQGIVFIGQLFEQRPYSRQRYSEWAHKFEDDAEISDAIKRIDEIIETRLVTGALGKELNPVIAIFTLKNKHGWVDKTEQDITTGGDKIGSYDPTFNENYLKFMEQQTLKDVE